MKLGKQLLLASQACTFPAPAPAPAGSEAPHCACTCCIHAAYAAAVPRPDQAELLAPASQVYDETEPDEVINLGEKGKRYPKLNWMKVNLGLLIGTASISVSFTLHWSGSQSAPGQKALSTLDLCSTGIVSTRGIQSCSQAFVKPQWLCCCPAGRLHDRRQAAHSLAPLCQGDCVKRGEGCGAGQCYQVGSRFGSMQVKPQCLAERKQVICTTFLYTANVPSSAYNNCLQL